MQKHLEVTRQRLQQFAGNDGLRSLIYSQRAPVSLSVYDAPGRISYAEAMQGSYRSCEVGEVFGPPWSTHWFRVEISIPPAWSGREVHFLWDSSSEAQIWQEGQPLQGLTGSERASGLRPEPLRPAYRLTRGAHGGELITLYVEMACNRLFGVEARQRYSLEQAEIGAFDPEAWDLLWDFTVIADMARELPENSPRCGQALQTANNMVNVVRFDDRSTWSQACEIAAEFLNTHNGGGQHNISAVGYAHLDTAWLWPLAETRRKAIRTFSNTMRLMEDYPDYKFVTAQAVHLAWLKEMAPELYAQVKARILSGQIILAGGCWVEPDCNIPSGESLVRQFLYGQRFYQQEYGMTCNEFWNPDVFGYSAALPQIILGAGARYFLTQKLSWNQFNKPTSQTFLWEGLDGSQVLTHFPPTDTYNSVANVKEVLKNSLNFKEHDRSRESMLLFGYGDGGGGPTPGMLEQLKRLNDLDGMPRVTQRPVKEFFARCEAEIQDPVTWVGELYFEYHRATYTTQAANKRDNRRSELLLRDVEFLSALAKKTQSAEYRAAEIERIWKLVLLNQFHDILPGSSITEVYQDSARHYAEILSAGAQLRQQALDGLFAPAKAEQKLIAVNTLSAARREVVELPEGSVETAQRGANGKALAIADAPSMGYAVIDPAAAPESPLILAETTEGFVFDNANLRAVFQRDGHLTSLFDKRCGREAIAAGAKANHFVFFDDRPLNFEAWDVDIFHLEKRDEVPGASSARMVEAGPLRVAVEFAYELSDKSWLKQVVSLSAVGARLEFANEVEWQERRRFLKVEFPLEIHSDFATYEVQFGHVRRPTHFNTTWDMARFEVCGHKWADLAEPGFGVALLNDSKYGYAAHGNVLRLSLLRGPLSPDPVADLGRHTFRYALYPHGGDFRSAGVVDEGYRFNEPLLVQPASLKAGQPESQSFLAVNQANVVIDTVKQAEDSQDWIVRLYESHGARCKVRLSTPLPVKSVARCNLLEEEEAGLPWKDGGVSLDVLPFKIITLKLKF
jgi:alpha-mannosidase